LISGFFLLPWTTVLACQMARLEKGFPIWTMIQWMGMNLIALFIWGPPIVWGTAAFSVSRAPELTLLLHELGFISFITPLTVFPIALVGLIVICFVAEHFGRTGYSPDAVLSASLRNRSIAPEGRGWDGRQIQDAIQPMAGTLLAGPTAIRMNAKGNPHLGCWGHNEMECTPWVRHDN